MFSRNHSQHSAHGHSYFPKDPCLLNLKSSHHHCYSTLRYCCILQVTHRLEGGHCLPSQWRVWVSRRSCAKPQLQSMLGAVDNTRSLEQVSHQPKLVSSPEMWRQRILKRTVCTAIQKLCPFFTAHHHPPGTGLPDCRGRRARFVSVGWCQPVGSLGASRYCSGIIFMITGTRSLWLSTTLNTSDVDMICAAFLRRERRTKNSRWLHAYFQGTTHSQTPPVARLLNTSRNTACACL